MRTHATFITLSLISSFAIASCTAEHHEEATEIDDIGASDDGVAHEDAGAANQGDFRQLLQLPDLAPPVCSQVSAGNMAPFGSYSTHASEVRLTSPGSGLVFWMNSMPIGRWEFRVLARAYYAGAGWPAMRLWKGSQLLGEVDVELSGHFETYGFELDNTSASANVPFIITFEGVATDKPLSVAGVEIVCPGISCGESVCTGEDVCCVHNPSSELACTDEISCPFTSQAQYTQITCDSHADCGNGNMCIAARFGNAEFAITCIDEDDYAPISGGAIMFPVCGSPGRDDDPCPAGLTCGQDGGITGIRTCI